MADKSISKSAPKLKQIKSEAKSAYKEAENQPIGYLDEDPRKKAHEAAIMRDEKDSRRIMVKNDAQIAFEDYSQQPSKSREAKMNKANDKVKKTAEERIGGASIPEDEKYTAAVDRAEDVGRLVKVTLPGDTDEDNSKVGANRSVPPTSDETFRKRQADQTSNVVQTAPKGAVKAPKAASKKAPRKAATKAPKDASKLATGKEAGAKK